jgi:hypothetical protein
MSMVSSQQQPSSNNNNNNLPSLTTKFSLLMVQLFGYLTVLTSGFSVAKDSKEGKFMFGVSAKRYETPSGQKTDQCWFYRDMFGLSTPELKRSRMPYSKIVDERG